MTRTPRGQCCSPPVIGSTEMASTDHLKLALSGHPGVGKTSIIRRFLHYSGVYRDHREFETSTQNLINLCIVV